MYIFRTISLINPLIQHSYISRSLLALSHSTHYNTVVDRPNSFKTAYHKMFKSILAITLLSTLVASAPTPMNFRLARRDGGSAYSGVGGEANGGNVNKYNRLVDSLQDRSHDDTFRD